ncbi:MAG TPA: lipocalin-like domain-containing protein [bacterium]|nr:lipocalin-like domain-containing protein [bacterium]
MILRAALLLCFMFPGLAAAADPVGFVAAKPGYVWKFPRDHGNHPAYRTEWWYYTGHLRGPEGQRYGFELTFFRQGLARNVDNPSSFTATDLYFAHFAISDLKAKAFWYAQKMDRPGPGLAGAASGGVSVFNEDWRAFHDGPGHRLQAQGQGRSIDLLLQSPFPAVLNGTGGYSVKGPGQASLYYSFPRMSVTGTLSVGGKPFPVTGEAWMDHEFFTDGLSSDEAGWDWFGLRFSDGTDLMLYRLRLKDGGVSPACAGTFTDVRGRATHLTASDIRAQPLESWKSPRTGAVYPTRWLIQVPKLQLTFQVGADFADQELDTAESTRVVYWEGSVGLSGQRAGKPVKGEGYMELTGYMP